jgi:Ca2+-binding RTX toxin-like protein
MNNPAVDKLIRTQLLERLAKRRPLYQAIKDHLPKHKTLHGEVMEPRLLLSADLVVAADALQDGLDRVDSAIDDFFDSTLLNTEIPLLVQSVDGEADAATLNDLLSIDVNLNGNYTDNNGNEKLDAGEAIIDAGWETDLKGFDDAVNGNGDGRVSLGEFFSGMFINPVKAELAGLGGAATNEEFTTFLGGLTDNFNEVLPTDTFGSMAFQIDNVGITDAADGGSLEISLDFSLVYTRDVPFDLGTGIEDLGITFTDLGLEASVTSEVAFGFTFGIDNIVAEVAGDQPEAASADRINFYAQFDSLTAETTATLNVATENVQIGFLGLAATGNFNLAAGVTATAKAGQDNRLTFAELNSGLDSAFDFSASAGTGLSGSMNLEVDSGIAGLSTDVDFTLEATNPFSHADFDGERFDLDFSYDATVLEDLLNFTKLSPTSFLSLLGQVADFLDGMSKSDLISGFEIPFAEASVGDVLDFADMLTDQLLYDDLNDDDDTTGTAKLLDEDNNADFTTVQQLVEKLAGILSESLPDGVDAQYDVASNEFKLNLDFSGDFTAFETPLNFNLDLAPIAEISNSSGTLALTGSGGIRMTLGIALGDVEGSDKITAATKLKPVDETDELNNDVETQDVIAITGDPVQDFSPLSDPNLSADATFTVKLAGTINKDGEHAITVEDTDAANITQLILAINSGLNDAGISLYVKAVEDDGDWFDLVVNTDGAGDAGDSFMLEGTANSVAKTQLGLGAFIQTGDTIDPTKVFTSTNPLQASHSSLAPSITLTISDVDLVLNSADLSPNTNILNLVRDINDAIVGTSLEGNVVVSSVGSRLVISATDDYDDDTISGLGPLTVAENIPLGFEAVSGNQDDFIIFTADGASHGISLDGLATIGELITRVNTVAGVTLSIDDAGTALLLTDSTARVGDNIFRVETTNGSKAALQLGIAFADASEVADADGVIDGAAIAGPTLADRLFLDNTEIYGSLNLAASEIEAAANFGFAAVTLEGGGELGISLSTGLVNPDADEDSDTSNDKRVTLAQLQANIGKDENGNRNIDKVVSTPTLSGDLAGDVYGQFDLTLGLEPGGDVPGLDLLGGFTPTISLTVDDLGDPLSALVNPDTDGNGTVDSNEEAEARLRSEAAQPNITIDTSELTDLPIGKLSDIGISEILDGIIAVTDFLGTFEEFGFLDDPIPVVEVSVNDVLSFADKLDAAVQASLDDPAGSIQTLEESLKGAFGLPADSTAVSLSLVGTDGTTAGASVLRIDLTLETAFSESMGIDFDLADLIADSDLDQSFKDLLSQASLAGSAGLAANGSATVRLAFGIDLGVDAADGLGDIWLFDDAVDGTDGGGTGLFGDLGIDGTDATFRGAIGPVGVFVQDGTVEIDASFNAGFDDDLLIFSPDDDVDDGTAQGLVAFDTIKDSFAMSLTGSVAATLPVYLPTDSNHAGDLTINGSIGATYAGDGDSPPLSKTLAVEGVGEILAAFNPLNFSLMDNILLVVDGVDLFLEGLQDIMDGEIGGITLPMVGDSLADGARFIEDFREDFVDRFREGVESFGSDGEDIVSVLLTELMVEIGFLSDDFDISRSGNFADDVDLKDSWIQWDLTLGGTVEDASADISLDLGIPGLGIETSGDIDMGIDWEMGFGFGLSYAQGAYLDLEGEELLFDVLVTVPDAEIKGTLGFLQLVAKDNGDTHLAASFGVDVVNSMRDGAAAFPDRLGFSDLSKMDFKVGIAAEAVADLGLTLQLDPDLAPAGTAGVFPTVLADFTLEWELGDLTVTQGADGYSDAGIVVAEYDPIAGNAIQEGLQLVEFTDVSLDLGSFLNDFLGPILGEIQGVTEPLEDIIDFITAPLPVISDLGPELSLVDIAEAFGDVDLGFIDSVADVVALVNAIPDEAEELMLNFGTYTVYDVNPLLAEDGSVLRAAIQDLDLSDKSTNTSSVDTNDTKRTGGTAASGSQSEETSANESSGSALQSMKDNGSFAFPIISDPSQIFGLLMGQEATLITYDMNPLSVDFSYSQYFPIFGPLGASITGSLGLTADFAFGYDTLGISQFADSDFRNPELIFNGFYVSDTENADGSGADVPELTLNLGLSAGAELNLGVAKGGVAGGVFADIYFNLFDPDHDGKVRIEELIGNVVTEFEYGDFPALAPLAVFDVTGKIYAKLFAYIEVDLLLVSWEWSDDITPEITILDFEIPFTRPPQLASEVGDGTLQLNMGEMAEMRLNGNVSDSAETFEVRSAGAGKIEVGTALGTGVTFWQKYDTPDTIIVQGGAGNDTIDFSGLTSQAIHFEIDGGAGNDTIILGGNSSSTSVVTGGSGDDFIVGSAGADVLIGGVGNDAIFGEGGNDQLFGDDVKIKTSTDPDTDAITTTLRVSIGATDGDDFIYGGTDDDIIIGGGGSDTLQGDVMKADVSAANKRQLIASSARLGEDLILGDTGFITLGSSVLTAVVEDTERGAEGGIDTIRGNGSNDIAYGGNGDDDIRGGDGEDTLHGETGLDEIHGDDGNDTLYGGDDNDTLRGGDHDDTIYGEDGADDIEGNAHADKLFGGRGNDLMHGNGGDDQMRGGSDPDLMYGDAGNDYLDGDFGDDLIFGDSGTYNPALATLVGTMDDTLVSSYGNDILDGEGGGDEYVVNFIGGNTDKLVTTFDTGNAASGVDNLTIHGSVEVSYDEATELLRSHSFLDNDDQYLLRANPDRANGLAFVALLNAEETSERVDYTADMESLTINSGLGNDYFALDDNRAATTINGGAGMDVFQVGQMFNLQRDTDPEGGSIQSHANPTHPSSPANDGETDIFATIETTRGFLSNGITEATTINGGSDQDSFIVFHNKAVLTLNGGTGDDEFSVRAFALAGSQETQRERTDISGGSDADLIQYAVNAPVGIDGGDGLDTLIVIGTEFRDDFIVTADGVFGAGVNVSFVNIENLKVDGAEGDDRFFVQGTNADTVTTIVGGLGSDSFNVAGDAPPIISNDLLGHSGKISHTVVTDGTVFDDVRVRDVVANVADSNEPGIVVTPVNEVSRVVEGDTTGGEGLAYATHAVVLSKPPRDDEKVVVTVFAPQPDQEAADANPDIEMINFTSSDGTISEDKQSVQLTFTNENWNTPQNVTFSANDDGVAEGTNGTQYGNITYSIASEHSSNSLPFLLNGSGATFVNDHPTIELPDGTILPTDGSLIGGTIKITSGLGEGQTRGIEDYDEPADTLELVTSWNIVPDSSSSFEIRTADGELVDGATGQVVAAGNNTTMTLAGAFSDAFPLATDNYQGDLRGATLEIVSGTGAGQERLIMSSTSDTVTLNKPWFSAPDASSVYQIQTYSAVKAPALEVRIDDADGDIGIATNADNTPAPGVKIIESNGSTDVIEPLVDGAPQVDAAPFTDAYQVVLTAQPAVGETVKVYVQPEETITTRGQIFYKELQVDVGGVALMSDSGGQYLEFNHDNWDEAQTVEVSAREDAVVDGGDTKVFPTIPRIVNEIQGPLIIEGQGTSELSIGSLGDPLMLPGENNTLPSLGVIADASDEPGAAATVDISLAVLNDAINQLDVAAVETIDDLIDYTFEITEGTGRGLALIINQVTESDGVVTLSFGPDSDWSELPDNTSNFTLSTTNPNLLVDELEQVDVLTVFNDESVTDDVGTLTANRLYGLGMGSDLTLGTTTFNGGITYGELENVTINLGKGNDTLNVTGTHTRGGVDPEAEDFFQTVTLVNAGRGGDTINIDLHSDVDGFFAVKGEEGDDSINATNSSLGIVAFGDEGGDTLRGGSGNDILIGDMARVDYLDDEARVITRLGLEHDFATMLSVPKTDAQVPSNQTDGSFHGPSLILSLQTDEGGEDSIYGNGGSDTIIGGAFGDTLVGNGSHDLIFGDNAEMVFSAVPGALGATQLIDAHSIDPTIGGVDNINSGAGNDIVVAGTAGDTVHAGSGNDLVFGDHAALTGVVSGASLPLDSATPAFTFNAIYITDTHGGGNDIVYGEDGRDILIGQQGSDTIYGGANDDDIIGGHNVANGFDTGDKLDGGSGRDVIAGDNAIINRRGDHDSELVQTLAGGTRLYNADGSANISSGLHTQVNVTKERNIELLNHVDSGDQANYFGSDYIAGGGGEDRIFGQMGNDTIQGDGSIGPVDSHTVVSASQASVDAATDGNDYVEGNAGNDIILGNLGQDILIGGSSDLFGLDTSSKRADGEDIIFGGSGNQLERNNTAEGLHARDADLILGDNARVATLRDGAGWLGYNFDDAYGETEQLLVRAYTLLDYTAGGAGSDIGSGDELHGEGGNDTILGMTGNDLLFGEAQDDNLIGGSGYERIYGGTGVDGVLGDDGIIQTSRNGVAEPLNGVDVATTETLIRTKGPFIGAVINHDGKIHKAVETQAWEEGGNDVIYGGLGDDYLHGGAGNDAISGAEAEAAFYNSAAPVEDVLAYDPDSRKLGAYDSEDPRSRMSGFLLNFEASVDGVKVEDGIDHIFGDLGHDWLVGGTGTDRMFGGLGDDLINADDNLDAGVNQLSTESDDSFAEGDFAFGGGGLDVMIANAARDRLFDWNGEFNSYYVPFSVFGAPTVNRRISPDTVDFLMDLGASSGADTSLDEPYGELGLVQKQDDLWGAQKGSPRDDQPGTLKGKQDDKGGPEVQGDALMAASAAQQQEGSTLAVKELRTIGQVAVQRWLDSGELSPQQRDQLAAMHLQITDLGGLKLALASNDGHTIYLDSTAAGYGWFVDNSPSSDSEFSAGRGVDVDTTGKMDLLSVVMHEIGHQLGFNHGDNGLMNDTLVSGVRTASLLAAGSVYTFDDEIGMQQKVAGDTGWLELMTPVTEKAQGESMAARVDWTDSF